MAPPGKLRVAQSDETVAWEIFRGHLLDATHTETRQRFSEWHVFLDAMAKPADAPLLSIHWQRDRNQLFVTRQILSHAFEAYEDAPGVILSRPVQKWARELVGMVEAESMADGTLTGKLERLVFLAVVGTSRLPITSLETPLPDFSLGNLAYQIALSDAEEPFDDPLLFLGAALDRERPLEEQAKALETALRAADVSTERLVEVLEHHAGRKDRGRAWLEQLLRAVFNGVGLSPYTRFADTFMALVAVLAGRAWFGPAAALALVGYMLRHLCRHLTAFNLTLFHNFGANYPDALFLDALLQAYLKLLSANADKMFQAGRAGRSARRALRQACLVRRHYEGHRVPDAPTSMGENVRVLPAPFVRVPEEQIREVGKRRHKLFDGTPTDELLGDLGRRVLAASLADLDIPDELGELGMAQYLDRPLGVLKEPGEVDATPLLSYEAFSRSIARRRIGELASAGWIDAARRDALYVALENLPVSGVAVGELNPRQRPGVVSIADALQAASDFVLLRTTRRSLDGLLSRYDLRALGDISPDVWQWLCKGRDVLLVQGVGPEASGSPMLRAYCDCQLRLELRIA